MIGSRRYSTAEYRPRRIHSTGSLRMRQGYGSPPGKTRGRVGRMAACPMPPPPSVRRCVIHATGRCLPSCSLPSGSPGCRGCCSACSAAGSARSPGAWPAAAAMPPRSTSSCASPRRTRPGASAWCATASMHWAWASSNARAPGGAASTASARRCTSKGWNTSSRCRPRAAACCWSRATS
ncbi:hypothetical protein D3C73_1023530 [compost metagenome]